MIHVRLLSEAEYCTMHSKRLCITYEERAFFDLLQEKKEFEDDASCSLLRHLHGDAAVAGKWYRRTTDTGAPCLPAISPEAKYGLVVIENSRKGLYTNLDLSFTEFEVEARMKERLNPHAKQEIPMVWDALAALDMDILLTFRKKDFSFVWNIPLENDFILENFPVNGTPTTVLVLNGMFGCEPEVRNDMLCIPNFFYDQRYHWYDDPKELLNTLDGENRFVPLARGHFSLYDFVALYQAHDSCVMRKLESNLEEQAHLEALRLPYEDSITHWQVLNHMAFLPEEGDSRRQLFLIIEETSDGSFRLRDEITVKYPSYDELLEDALDTYRKGTECILMAIDVEEVMSRACDIHKTICAFRISGDIIETFDALEGQREFARTLRRAIDSGQCTFGNSAAPV